MNRRIFALMFACIGIQTINAQTGYPVDPVPFTAVKVKPESFWGQRLQAAREVTIPLAFSKCESEGRYKNFVQCQHPSDNYAHTKFPFDDTDVYKTIEGASYILMTMDKGKEKQQLTEYIDSVLVLVGKAQEEDGYLFTPRTKSPGHPHSWVGKTRWEVEEINSHELYNLGHMVDAACAHYQATGSRQFLDIAVRYADCVVKEIGPDATQVQVVPGHQIAEMALSRLYALIHATPALKDLLPKSDSYLKEAQFLLDQRGKTKIKNAYTQSHLPIIEQDEAVGHAVRAGYMYAGIADVAALTSNQEYVKAIDAIWDNIVTKKYYLTGGVGSRHNGEAFGDNYELPNLTAYNETCAAIAQVYLNHRMFLLHGESKYYDCVERSLYNGVISGMSMDGGRFFYPNPLESDGIYAFNSDNTTTRQPWFGCACCPSNVCRFIPSVPGYVYAVRDNRLYVNLFMANSATVKVQGKDVALEQTTDYPWNGDITVRIGKTKAKKFALMIRIPGWVRNEVVPSDLYSYADDRKQAYSVSVNGQEVTGNLTDGYMMIDRNWKKGDEVSIHFDMEARTVVANDKVADDKGLIGIERGPLVYCAEAKDNQDVNLHQLLLGKKTAFKPVPQTVIQNTECQIADSPVKTFEVTALTSQVQKISVQENGTIASDPYTLKLIPYYAWNHRGANAMTVWFPYTLSRLQE